VFNSVLLVIIAISAVVALANLASFNSDAGDKVRPTRLGFSRPTPRKRWNLPTRFCLFLFLAVDLSRGKSRPGTRRTISREKAIAKKRSKNF
jgi:hypothetical protein